MTRRLACADHQKSNDEEQHNKSSLCWLHYSEPVGGGSPQDCRFPMQRQDWTGKLNAQHCDLF